MGEIILGRLGKRYELDRLLGHGTSMTFIYGEPKELQPISNFGAHCYAPNAGDIPPVFSIQDFEPDVAETYFSWAPLSGIRSIRTFNDKSTGLCRGIIFQYDNGGLRAVGQCRQPVDPSTLVLRPSMLCFRSTSFSTSQRGPICHGVLVKLAADGMHRHDCSGWNCLHLGVGVLTFSFTSDSSYMSHQVHWP